MDNNLIFKDFSNICNILTKISGNNNVILSNGVFLIKNEGIFTICTFTEKMEKNILHILGGLYEFDPTIISLINKYSNIRNIEYLYDRIRFTINNIFNKTIIDIMGKAESELLMSNINLFTKDINGDQYIDIHKISELDMDTRLIFEKLNNLDINIYKEIEISNEEITTSESAISIEVDDYKIRIAKSLFGNVVKSDKLLIRFIPYKDNSSIFLVMATNNKEKCKLINLVDAVRL